MFGGAAEAVDDEPLDEEDEEMKAEKKAEDDCHKQAVRYRQHVKEYLALTGGEAEALDERWRSRQAKQLAHIITVTEEMSTVRMERLRCVRRPEAIGVVRFRL